jgi:hypothetical protein
MIRLEIKGLEELQGYVEALAKNQLPFATMLATNDLAFEIMNAEKEMVRRSFDRPKPQTIKNIFVKKATSKQYPVARVRFDQVWDKNGIDEYMEANIKGGRRIMKPSEKRLGSFYLPGVGARLDQYGNMKGGQITQILSRLGRFGDVAGYDMNQTDKSKLRRLKQRQAGKTSEYFIITKQRGGLKPGVYQRGTSSAIGSGRSGRGIVPVMVFTKRAPAYKPRWPFFQEGQRIIDTRFKQVFEKRIADALRTAR